METIEVQRRGQLTDRVKQRSIELFGHEMSQKELRLLPYIQYTLVNNQRLNPEHLDEKEKEILSVYVQKGWIVNGVTKCGRPMISEGEHLKVTKEFWLNITEILWLGYVDLSEQ